MKKLFMLSFTSIFVLAACNQTTSPATTNQGSTTTQTNPQTQNNAQPDNNGPFTGALKGALALGVPMKCTYQVEGNQYEGYIKGQMYRGKMQSQQGQMGEVIVKDNCMWTWESGKTEGFTMCFEPEEGQENETIWDNPESGYDSNTQYSCLPAIIGDDQFTPPKSVTFMDFNQLMQNQGVDLEKLKQMGQ